MEIPSKPACRYALAFWTSVRTQGNLDAIRGDVDLLLRQVEGMPDLRRFLRNQLIPQAIRLATLRELFEGHLQLSSLRFIYFLDYKRRLGLLPGILQSFQQIDEAQRGVVRSQVVYAQPVEPEIARQVESWIVKRIPATELRIQSRTDAALIGGLTIRVNDWFWDGSVAGGLRRINRRLESPLPDRGRA